MCMLNLLSVSLTEAALTHETLNLQEQKTLGVCVCVSVCLCVHPVSNPSLVVSALWKGLQSTIMSPVKVMTRVNSSVRGGLTCICVCMCVYVWCNYTIEKSGEEIYYQRNGQNQQSAWVREVWQREEPRAHYMDVASHHFVFLLGFKTNRTGILRCILLHKVLCL